MEYVSTRGSAPALDFEGATLAGLASDGGLYLPREWPRFSKDEIAAMAGLPYAELAARVAGMVSGATSLTCASHSAAITSASASVGTTSGALAGVFTVRPSSVTV
jgi:threonine synthase